MDLTTSEELRLPDRLYRSIVRPLLFRLDPEQAHRLSLEILSVLGRRSLGRRLLSSCFSAPSLPSVRFGLRFPNPVGLAAGMDKDGRALPAWEALGFGFSEAGGVTLHPQPGNPPPRLFRIPQDGAILNRMGFNNRGAMAMARALAAPSPPRSTPLGINLGKSLSTPLEKAHQDLLSSFQALRPHAHFFVINLSSPNTPGLTSLQEREPLKQILGALSRANLEADPRPLLLKISPDLSTKALDSVIELALEHGLAGLVATNTTIRASPLLNEKGGLSGRPLRDRSTAVVAHIHRTTRGALPVVGVGGIEDVPGAWAKIAAGACLCQLYTGLVYQGPGLAKRLVSGILRQMDLHALASLDEAVGCSLPYRPRK